MRFLGRALLRIFTRTTVMGVENFPKNGPLILVGNHTDVTEVALMALYAPFLVEMMGASDIPLDTRFQWIFEPYGYIPINRGNWDRKGLNAALEVLKQGGVIGIFPEGGIWDSKSRPARTGVAWLSYMAQAPVVPIGFGGVNGAFEAATKLERPRITMHIGNVIPPVQGDVPGKPRKEALEDAAMHIMTQVESLIPEEERNKRTPVEEIFDFELLVATEDGETISLTADFTQEEREALGQLFTRPILIDVFTNNLRMKEVTPLKRAQEPQDPEQLAIATEAMLNYLDKNPQFFNYRFGYRLGTATVNGLRRLRQMAAARRRGARFILRPLRMNRAPSGSGGA
jgi:1-acyl-sn-glycerol-3-phosphate acyltransferase